MNAKAFLARYGALVALGAAGVAILYWLAKRGALSNAGATLGRGAVDLVDGVLTGSVKAVGELVGVPDTDKDECGRALIEGRTWDASFHCPAKDFLSAVFRDAPTEAELEAYRAPEYNRELSRTYYTK